MASGRSSNGIGGRLFDHACLSGEAKAVDLTETNAEARYDPEIAKATRAPAQ
jgi:hypothetical protein